MKFNVFIRIINWKAKYTTLSEHFQNLKENRRKAKYITLAHKYTTVTKRRNTKQKHKT
jgi:hypothetical protein